MKLTPSMWKALEQLRHEQQRRVYAHKNTLLALERHGLLTIHGDAFVDGMGIRSYFCWSTETGRARLAEVRGEPCPK